MPSTDSLHDPARATENFSWREFYCPLAKSLPLTDLAFHHVSKLQLLREELGRGLKVNSGYRSPEHNARVGGATQSMHLEFATDVTPVAITARDQWRPGGSALVMWCDRIAGIAEDLGFSGIGRYDSFVHLDCRAFIQRPQARWDKRDGQDA